ncbi:branched-chain amino acid ABC transporter permease [Oscillospiraceae bacterium MB08-C2-2]|nr:branched-chain amino acid ABC transporter permease [Oscillospiraceae bacterium MB08-C2-2]
MSFNVVLTVFLNGLAMGMVYALVAMGIILLVRAIGVLNFAQGELLMLGAYITFALQVQMELPIWVVVPVALISFAVIALIFMFTIYWPLRDASYPTAIIIATMGASIVIKEIAMLVWGGLPLRMPPLLENEATGGALLVNIAGVNVSWQLILTAVVGMVIIGLVFFIFEKLYAGKMIQAASQDKFAAELMGIPTIVTTAATYIISITLAGVGGFMVGPIFTVNVTLGTLLLRAFAGVIIGGLGNIKGAIIGSVLVGLIESTAAVRWSTYKDAVIFLVLLAFLVVRPQGLFGMKIKDKA